MREHCSPCLYALLSRCERGQCIRGTDKDWTRVAPPADGGVLGDGGEATAERDLIAGQIEARTPSEHGEPLKHNLGALTINAYRAGMLEAARIVREVAP